MLPLRLLDPGFWLAVLLNLVFGRPEPFDYVSTTRAIPDVLTEEDTTKRGW